MPNIIEVRCPKLNFGNILQDSKRRIVGLNYRQKVSGHKAYGMLRRFWLPGNRIDEFTFVVCRHRTDSVDECGRPMRFNAHIGAEHSPPVRVFENGPRLDRR